MCVCVCVLSSDVSSSVALQLSSIEGLLSKTHQPQSYIVSSLREKEKALKELRNRVRELEAQLNQSNEEKAKLMETKNQMASDLEKLLSHREVSLEPNVYTCLVISACCLVCIGVAPHEAGFSGCGQPGPPTSP